jgi:hypothetical protein
MHVQLPGNILCDELDAPVGSPLIARSAPTDGHVPTTRWKRRPKSTAHCLWPPPEPHFASQPCTPVVRRCAELCERRRLVERCCSVVRAWFVRSRSGNATQRYLEARIVRYCYSEVRSRLSKNKYKAIDGISFPTRAPPIHGRRQSTTCRWKPCPSSRDRTWRDTYLIEHKSHRGWSCTFPEVPPQSSRQGHERRQMSPVDSGSRMGRHSYKHSTRTCNGRRNPVSVS